MNTPDIDAIIDEICGHADAGNVVCLNLATGEMVWAPVDEHGDVPEDEEAYYQAISGWEDKIEIQPIDPEDNNTIIKYFIEDNVREGSRLHERLSATLNASDPVAAFEEEVTRCKGAEIWREFRERCVETTVIDSIVDVIGTPNVHVYPLNEQTLALMGEAYLSGRYFYVSGQKVVISQVVDQFAIDPDSEDYMPLDTHYTIREWALRYAEEQEFHEMGGGLVHEPFDKTYGSPEEVDLDELFERFRGSIDWAEAEDREFAEFCEMDDTVDDLWNEVSDYPEDYDGPQVPLETPAEARRKYPDGKYPVYGKPDDEFSDDNPWGAPTDFSSFGSELVD